MNSRQALKKDYTTPALFCVCIILVVTFLVVSLTFQRPSYPSVAYGATDTEVEAYAYSLLELDASSDSDTPEHYLEALAYYDAQIAAAKDAEQRFNLQLGLASLLGKTGDPAAGLQVLGAVDFSSLPLDAKYYLYSTYAYLHQRNGNEQEAADYLLRISDEGIYDYVAKLDAGEIVPGETEETDAESAETESETETETEAETNPEPETTAESTEEATE